MIIKQREKLYRHSFMGQNSTFSTVSSGLSNSWRPDLWDGYLLNKTNMFFDKCSKSGFETTITNSENYSYYSNCSDLNTDIYQIYEEISKPNECYWKDGDLAEYSTQNSFKNHSHYDQTVDDNYAYV
ncbi:hypothetical protein RF11_03356 [Thelohanellus kitauei]|uniref:Uncharacterized protein n=1 Tax=Thelohanellus kitauei TaxID=669202 RepID=A0A0C2JF01_THEKT|nr:hypothetical protein RF11_03356 [Thelohanellus kitauei]